MPAIYLDDLRHPRTDRDWTICRSADEAKAYCLANGTPSHISFDHDLGDDVPTGYDFAHWLVDTDLDQNGSFLPTDFSYHVHSANPVGEQNIRGLLDRYLRHKAQSA